MSARKEKEMVAGKAYENFEYTDSRIVGESVYVNSNHINMWNGQPATFYKGHEEDKEAIILKREEKSSGRGGRIVSYTVRFVETGGKEKGKWQPLISR